MPMGILLRVLMILRLVLGFLSGGSGWAFWGGHALTFVLSCSLGPEVFRENQFRGELSHSKELGNSIFSLKATRFWERGGTHEE